jgi:hypothetical protein
MLTAADADLLVSQHLATTPRAVHTRFVPTSCGSWHANSQPTPSFGKWSAYAMTSTSFRTCDDWSQHGLLTVRWLGDRLPAEAQLAIASHDHRAGIQADTLLADTLKIADVLAVIDARLGRNVLSEAKGSDVLTALRSHLVDRSYLCDMLERYTRKHGLPVSALIDIVASSTLPSH